MQTLMSLIATGIASFIIVGVIVWISWRIQALYVRLEELSEDIERDKDNLP